METVYLGHDNSIDMILKSDGVAQSLAAVTSMTLTFGTLKITSTNQANDPIKWNQGGYATGEVRFFLGALTIPPGGYTAPLVVYDASNDDGIVWTNIRINVVAEVEGT